MTFTVGWGQRALGLAVLLGVLGLLAALRFDVPWPTAIVLGVLGIAALASTISNFGERVHADDEGLSWENVLLKRLGAGSAKRAAWSEIVSAVELDGRTLFLSIDGRKRWVLDALADHEGLRELLEQHGVPVEQRTRPRLRDMGRGPRQPPA